MNFGQFETLVKSSKVRCHLSDYHWNGVTTVLLHGLWEGEVPNSAYVVKEIDSRRYAMIDEFLVAVAGVKGQCNGWFQRIQGKTL